MADDPAFIRTIADKPDDDAPRLVYADVLEETGEPLSVARAEFIRLDIELHRLPVGDPRRREVAERIRERLLPNALAWWRELPSPPGIAWDWFVRGFAERLQGRFSAFVRNTPALFAAAPLRDVKLIVANPDSVSDLARLPDVTRLRTLELARIGNHITQQSGRIDVADAKALADSPHLKHLNRLIIEGGLVEREARAILHRRFGKTWRE